MYAPLKVHSHRIRRSGAGKRRRVALSAMPYAMLSGAGSGVNETLFIRRLLCMLLGETSDRPDEGETICSTDAWLFRSFPVTRRSRQPRENDTFNRNDNMAPSHSVSLALSM